MKVEKELTNISDKEDIPASNSAFLNLPLKTPTRQTAQFNIYNWKFVIFVKFKML